jgi:hypothetical protein
MALRTLSVVPRVVVGGSKLLQHGTNEQQEGTQCKLFSIKDSELD